MIRFKCTSCSRVFKAPPHQAGRKTKCTACGTVLTIPADAGEAEGALVGAGAAVAIGQIEIGTSSDMLSVVKLRRPGASSPLLAPAPERVPDEQGRVKVVCKQCNKKFRARQPDHDAMIICNQCGAEILIPGRRLSDKSAADKSAADKIDRPSRSDRTDKSDKPEKSDKPSKSATRPMGEDSIMMVLGTGNMPKAAPGTLAADSLGAGKSLKKIDGLPTAKTDGKADGHSPGSVAAPADADESAGLESNVGTAPTVGSTTIGEHTVDAQGRVLVVCESCGKKFRSPIGETPKRLKCTGCGILLTVPGRRTNKNPPTEKLDLGSAKPSVDGSLSPRSAHPAVSGSKTGSASPVASASSCNEEDFAAKARALVTASKQGPRGPTQAASTPSTTAARAAVSAEPVEDEEQQMTSSSGLFEVSDLMAQLDAMRRKAGAERAAKNKTAAPETDKHNKPASKPVGGSRVELTDDPVRERKPAPEKSRGKTAANPHSGEPPDKAGPNKPPDKTAEKTADRSSEKAAETSADRAGEKAADKPAGKSVPPPSNAMKAAIKALETSTGTSLASVDDPSERVVRPGGGWGLIDEDREYPTWAFVLGVAVILCVGIFGWRSIFSGDGTGPVDRVALNARAVSAAEDDTSGLLREFPVTMGHAVYAVAFSPDGKTLAACAQDRLVYLWSIPEGKELLKFDAGPEQTALAFSPDGGHLITGGKDGVIRIWNPGDGKPIFQLPGHAGQVSALLVTDDGKFLITAGRDSKIHIWDRSAAPYANAGVLLGHSSPVNALAVTADGRKLFSGAGPGGNDQTLRVWDIGERREIARPGDSQNSVVLALAVSPDGTLVVTGGSEKPVRFVDTRNGQTATMAEHKDFVVALAISPDGKTMASAAGRQDKDVLVWNLPDRTVRQRLIAPGGTGPVEGVGCLAFSPRSKRLATGGMNGTVRLYGIGD